ncbi:MAG: hypothetical protein AAGP08_18410, partial [Pseudomonadota bacterium]
MTKKILMIVANPATSPVTGWPIGFWWAELSHAWLAFTDAGYEVVIASPEGGDLIGDGYSDPEDDSGYSAHEKPMGHPVTGDVAGFATIMSIFLV